MQWTSCQYQVSTKKLKNKSFLDTSLSLSLSLSLTLLNIFFSTAELAAESELKPAAVTVKAQANKKIGNKN